MRRKRWGNTGDANSDPNGTVGNTNEPSVSAGEPATDLGEPVTNAESTFAGIPVVDPATIAGTGSDSGSGTGKRRGRPPGSGSTKAKAVPQNLTETISTSLFGLHMFAAGLLNCDELILDASEAKQLATAIKGVTDLYSMTIDPRIVAWGNLMVVTGMVYGPRFVAFKNRTKKETGPKVVPMKEKAKVNGVQPLMTPSQMYGNESGVND